jgi:hypothetical protein
LDIFISTYLAGTRNHADTRALVSLRLTVKNVSCSQA